MKFYCTQVIKLALAASFLILASCSNSSDPNVQELPPVTLEAKSGLVTGNADFGTFAYNATSAKLVTFTLKNNGTEVLTGPASIDKPENFSLSVGTCSASLARNASCNIKVVFDPRGRTAGTYTANLNYDSVFVALTAEVEPAPGAVGGVEYTLSSVKVTSVDFGEVTQKQNVLKTIAIKNTGNTALVGAPIIEGSTGFTLTYNPCSNLAKGATCTVKVNFNGTSLEGPQLANLNYGGFLLALSGVVATPAAPTSNLAPNIVLLDSNGQELSAKNLGVLSGVQSTMVNVTVKNSGTMASSSLTTALTDANNFQLLYDACASQSLAVNQTCLMKVAFGASGKNVGSYSTNVKVEAKTGALSAQVEAYQCPEGKHVEGGPTTCVSDFKVCRGIVNGQGTQTWNGTDYGICKASSCNDGYMLNVSLNKCVSGGDPCDGVALGGMCSDGLVFVGTTGTKKVQTTPGFCTNSLSPTCTPETPALLKTRQNAQLYCQNLRYGYSSGFTLPASNDWNFVNQLWNNSPGMGNAYTAGGYWFSNTSGNSTQYFDPNPWSAMSTSDDFKYLATRCVRIYTAGCNEGYHNDGPYCVADVGSCPVTNGVGSRTWSVEDSSWSACSNVVCNSGFALNSSGNCQMNRVCGAGESLQGDVCVANNPQVCNSNSYMTANGCQPRTGDPCFGVAQGGVCADGLIFVGNNGNKKVQTTPGFCTNSTTPTCTESTPALLKTAAGARDYCSSLQYVYDGGFSLMASNNWSLVNHFWNYSPGMWYASQAGGYWFSNMSGNSTQYFDPNPWSAMSTSDNYKYLATRCIREYVPVCDPGYHEEGGNCISNSGTCSVTNGSGSRIWEGSSWGTCSNVVCNSGFYLNATGNCQMSRECSAGQTLQGDTCVATNPQVCDSNSYMTANGCQPRTGDPCGGVAQGGVCADGLIFVGTLNNQTVQTTPGFCTNSTTPTCTESTPALLKTAAGARDYCSSLQYVYDGGFSLLPNNDWGLVNHFWNYSPGMWYASQSGGYWFSNSSGNTYQYFDPNPWSTMSTSDNYKYLATRCVRLYDPSCGSGMHKENGVCASNVATCSITNGTGTKVWNGTAWGTCSNITCSSGFALTSNGMNCVLIRNCSGGQTYNPDLDVCQ